MGGALETSGGAVIELGGGIFSFAGAKPSENALLDFAAVEVSLAKGQTLTLTANDALNAGADFTGPGTLATHGTVSESGAHVGGGATGSVTATVDQSGGSLALSDGHNPSVGGALSIGSTGAFDLTDDNGVNYSYAQGAIVNAGMLAKTGGANTSDISDIVTNAGTISAETGTLEFTGFLKDSGALLASAGAVIALDGGGELDGKIGAATSTGLVRLDAGAYTTTKTLTLANEGTNADLQIKGANWTISGVVNDNGVVNDSGLVTLGGESTAGKLTIGSSGTWDFVNDSGLLLGPATGSTIANSGLFEKTGGTNTSAVAPAIANKGTIQVASGGFDIQGAVSGAGSDVIAGAATLEFDGGVAGGQTASFTGSGGTLELLNPGAFAGKISGFDTVGSNDVLLIGGPWTYAGFSENSAHTAGTMTFSNGSATARLTLLGDYAASSVHHTTNAGGMTVVTYG